MDGVRDVRLPVGDGALLGGKRLEDAAEPREHGEAAVLELLHLELLEVTGLSEAEGVEAAAGGDGELELREGVLEEAGAVALGGADEEDLEGENGPEGGVAGALGGEGGDGAGELVGDGGAVVGGAQGTGGEPGDAGAVLGGPGAGHAEHRPAAVDDLALGVLVIVEGDDGGLATAGVDAELGVEVRGGSGAELGNLREREESRSWEMERAGGPASDVRMNAGARCRRVVSREGKRTRPRHARRVTAVLKPLRCSLSPRRSSRV